MNTARDSSQEGKARTVCIVGASGWLGRKIADALDARGAQLVLALRGGRDHPGAPRLAGLVGRGARIVAADVTRPETLGAAVEGVDVVVSAVQGGRDVVVEGQLALAKAAFDAGVTRMLPSDYCVDHRQVDRTQNIFLGLRREADEAIGGAGMPQTNMLCGAFLDLLALSLHEDPFFGLVDWERWQVRFWGDADRSYDFTLTDDVADATAEVALDPHAEEGAFNVVGTRASPRELASLVGRLAGREVGLHRLGDLQELHAEIRRRQDIAPSDPTQWGGLQFHALMASGACGVGPSQHGRYGLEPTSAEVFLTGVIDARRTT